MKYEYSVDNGCMFYWTFINWMEDSGIRLNEQNEQSLVRRNTKDVLLSIRIIHETEQYLANLYQVTCI